MIYQENQSFSFLLRFVKQQVGFTKHMNGLQNLTFPAKISSENQNVENIFLLPPISQQAEEEAHFSDSSPFTSFIDNKWERRYPNRNQEAQGLMIDIFPGADWLPNPVRGGLSLQQLSCITDNTASHREIAAATVDTLVFKFSDART